MNSATQPPHWKRLVSHALEPIDAASVAFFRIVFGLLLAYEAIRYVRFGWVTRYFVDSPFQFSYYGFGWVRVFEQSEMILFFLMTAVLAFMVGIGFLYRIAAPLFFAAVTYWFLLDQTRYLNHMYLVSLYAFLLCFVPAHRMWSLDALIFRSPANGTVPRWALWIMQFQMGCVYFFGAVAKWNRDWLLEGEPLRMWTDRRSDYSLVGPFIQWEGAPYFLSWSGMLIDLLAVPFLLWKRTRLAMFLILLSFHLANKYLFNIGIFPWLSIGATTLFLAASWPRMVLRLPAFVPRALPLRPSAYVIPAILVPYVLLQLFLPLRHHLYPGDVAWTEEGHRFSWRMKLRSKSANGYFMVQTPDYTHIEIVRPEDIMERFQVRTGLTRPDMVLQVAHRLAREEEARLGEPVQVFAHITCRLNHHQEQLLIDPTVDLARVERTLWPADWIMPFQRMPERYWLPEVQTPMPAAVPRPIVDEPTPAEESLETE